LKLKRRGGEKGEEFLSFPPMGQGRRKKKKEEGWGGEKRRGGGGLGPARGGGRQEKKKKKKRQSSSREGGEKGGGGRGGEWCPGRFLKRLVSGDRRGRGRKKEGKPAEKGKKKKGDYLLTVIPQKKGRRGKDIKKKKKGKRGGLDYIRLMLPQLQKKKKGGRGKEDIKGGGVFASPSFGIAKKKKREEQNSIKKKKRGRQRLSAAPLYSVFAHSRGEKGRGGGKPQEGGGTPSLTFSPTP